VPREAKRRCLSRTGPSEARQTPIPAASRTSALPRFSAPPEAARALTEPGAISQVLLPLGGGIAFRHVSMASPPPAARVVDRATSEALFLQHLPRIEKTIGVLGRRHGFRDAEAADLASWVKLRLIEDDYAVFQKFRGESSITTYLTVVIATLIQDYKVQRWGRWRPSAAALRKGRMAVKLEALVYRQGYQLSQAAELLRSSGDTTLNDREISQVLSDLPRRGPPRPREVGEESLDTKPASSSAEDFVDREADVQERTAVEGALKAAVERMSPEDQCILTMRFWQDASVADIARTLNVAQKPLYRRLDRAFAQLRRELAGQGISSERARTLIGGMEQ
jgi:RNA polymerase sigma factor (sigma-70 family)